MKKTYRYLMYVGIGIIIYLFMDRNDEGGESLQKFHEKAPAIILIIIVLLLVLNFIKQQREKKRNG